MQKLFLDLTVMFSSRTTEAFSQCDLDRKAWKVFPHFSSKWWSRTASHRLVEALAFASSWNFYLLLQQSNMFLKKHTFCTQGTWRNCLKRHALHG